VEFVELPVEEYELFVSTHELGNFLQSTAIGQRRAASGWQTHYVGVRDENNQVIAAALLMSRPIFLRLHLFESLQGPIMNYDDEALVQFFFARLRIYLRQHDALRLRLNPPLQLRHRDALSNIVDDGYDGNKYVDLLKKQGLFHLSNQTVDNDPGLLRWYSAKDMRPYKTADELMDSLDAGTRRSIRGTQKMGIEVKVLPHDDIDEFYKAVSHTGTRRGFSVRDKQYYQDLATYFGPERVQFCVAQLSLDTFQANVQQQLGEVEARIAKLEAKIAAKTDADKLQRQLKTEQNAATHYRVKLANIEDYRKDGDTLTMAGAVFIHYGNELVYLSGGSYEEYVSFRAPYAIQWHAQLYALEHGIPRYNFYGTKGNFSGHPKQHGVYIFKKGLGGVIEEQIGYFEMYSYSLLSNMSAFTGAMRGLPSPRATYHSLRSTMKTAAR
jgi:peptidoglycan pentaglycine glycine transferase (the second and third glycine)